MTTPSQITYCAAQARTVDLVRAADATRVVQRSPRSTFRPIAWIGRCSGVPSQPNAAHGHP